MKWYGNCPGVDEIEWSREVTAFGPVTTALSRGNEYRPRTARRHMDKLFYWHVPL